MTQTCENGVKAGGVTSLFAPLHLSPPNGRNPPPPLPPVVGNVSVSVPGRFITGRLFAAVFFFSPPLKARLNSQFVPLNNSGGFIYFEFSSHYSSHS